MEPARYLVGRLVELAAGVKLGHHDLRGRDALRLMHLDRDAGPVVVDRDARVDVDGDRDARAVAGERLVDRAVDDLEDEVMETTPARVSDVHYRALAHVLQALADLDA